MEQELIQLIGKVEHIVYRNESNFYTVLIFKIYEKGRRISVTGYMDNVEEDTEYIFYGQYTTHPKYGIQFSLQSYERQLPQERDGVIKYLSSSLFDGIGKKIATKVVDTLGENCIDLINEDNTILDKVELSDKQKRSLLAGIKLQDSKLSSLIQFCTTYSISSAQAKALHQRYGDEALTRLKENPYAIIEELEGFGFKTADKLGLSLGFKKEDPRRLEALLITLVMNLCVSNGDSYVSLEILEDRFARYCKSLEYNFYDLLHNCILRQQLVEEEGNIFPITQYQAECGISNFIAHFPYFEIKERTLEEVTQALKDTEQIFNITYDTVQENAIKEVFHNPIQIITGGPGTGKTTVVKAICHMYSILFPDSTVICAAPTGRASKRLKELTDIDSSTIHSLLGWNIDTNTFSKNENDPILADLLIIDEFSMVDDWLFYNLLKASTTVRKICIIGDEEQLPSVGPGCVLRDLIRSEVIPYVRLEHIYRQREGSDVISLAHQISTENIDLDSLVKDVRFFECEDRFIPNIICQIVRDALNKNYSLYDIQVLSPMHRGICGIDSLNNALQESFNPSVRGKREIKVGYMIFRVGDKVLQLKNQPDDMVFNGDIGIIEDILDAKESDTNQTTIVVNFQDNIVFYTPDEWNNITLAYCISVHKSQGSEYAVVIMPFSRQHTHMLQKNLIYTGITRSRKSLILLGDKSSFINGVLRKDLNERKTKLTERIQHDYVNWETFEF